ncbi:MULTISPECIES: hypothetical protein [Bradyrhizobium]|uniref:hypothetical protein n=1 Tax=Bradyrhizobium centrosematis TaxID=1300039 RepID=UPI0021675CB1|nr:hypothetical protein [Bradyrhizobium centrosematis]MCS3765943.1 hypothetical protein [Bradyrhizobium centrosematis]MCS3778349.1 hypothetical protein [Bradyrhizobium centrosematis]
MTTVITVLTGVAGNVPYMRWSFPSLPLRLQELLKRDALAARFSDSGVDAAIF